MTLQEIYNTYVVGHKSLRDINIIYRDKYLETRTRCINAGNFFEMAIDQVGKEVILNDTDDYPEFDNAKIEIIDDSYEKDFGDPGCKPALIYREALQITLKEPEPELKDYVNAIYALKERLKNTEQTVTTNRREKEEIESFYSGTYDYPRKMLGDKHIKYVYGYCVPEEGDDDILYELVTDLMYAFHEGEEFGIDFFNNLDDPDTAKDLLQELIEQEITEEMIRESYDVAEDEYPPSNEDVADDYYSTIKTLVKSEYTLAQLTKIGKWHYYRSYTLAKEEYMKAKKIWPQLAFYEKSICSDGKVSYTLLESYKLMNGIGGKKDV